MITMACRRPSEGKHTVYLWLRDGAGNVNYQTRNVLNQALWYDATPPYHDAPACWSTAGRVVGIHRWFRRTFPAWTLFLAWIGTIIVC